jgi:hypothetical protein
MDRLLQVVAPAQRAGLRSRFVFGYPAAFKHATRPCAIHNSGRLGVFRVGDPRLH